ncbi:MAG: transposase [bacterium]
MPRPPRAVVPGQPLHLIQRGVNRVACFTDDLDRRHFIHTLRVVSERTGCAIHAYVLMVNHVHLLITPNEERSPSRMMQMLGRSYVRWFNERHDRSGTLWEGRYRSSIIDSERYFLACSRYVELNPVRAGMVTRPDAYDWSSSKSNAHGVSDALVTHHPLYLALGRTPSARRASYRTLFSTPLDADAVDAIRVATNAGSVVGATHSRRTIEQALARSVTRSGHGGDRRSDAVRKQRTRHHRSTMLTPADPS